MLGMLLVVIVGLIIVHYADKMPDRGRHSYKGRYIARHKRYGRHSAKYFTVANKTVYAR